jgi:outer membrane protein
MKKTLLAMALLSSLSTATFANQAGDILIRGGATSVNPDSAASGVYVEALGGLTPLSLSVEDNTQLGLNFAYFFDSNWAVELLAATPFTHDIIINDPQGIALGVLATAVDGAKLAETTQLPPTLSVLYYIDTGTAIKPYVGAGVNYTHFFKEEFSGTAKSLGFNDLQLDASFGLSAQVGVDYEFDKNWSVNISARYIDIGTEATFMIGDTIAGSSDVDVNPMVYSVMLGYKF